MFQFNAQDLRRNPTVSEQVLWQYLKARQMVGLKFRRQHPLGPFIVDFVCLKKKIIIEVDGPVHDRQREYDQRRDAWLESEGFTVMRIKNESLEEDRMGVLMEIRRCLLRRLGF